MTDHNSVKHTFGKQEKLCSQKTIDKIFSGGSSFVAYPLRVVYISEKIESGESVNLPQLLISVSKRKFKRAVKRNRVKRLIREAYRLNKQPFVALSGGNLSNLSIAFIYLKDELPTYAEIEKAIVKTSITLAEKLKSEANK